MTSKFDEVAAALDAQPVPTPTPHADVLNTLTVIHENVCKNRDKVVEQIGMLHQQLEVQTETLRQFNTMEAALQRVLANPTTIAEVAGLLAPAANPVPEVPSAPLASADSAADSASTPASDSANGDAGYDGNGSPVPGDEAAAS